MPATQSTGAQAIWTVDLVQQHAQAAVSVEMYTLPFYLTALSSIQDVKSLAYQQILSVCIEEMLHMELAANLCLALGTMPNFQAPNFGAPIPFLDPNDPATGTYALINAVLGPLDETTLNTMLDIETPEEFETFNTTTPQAPYSSIGAFYESLRDGIKAAGVENFPWANANQKFLWTEDDPQRFSEVIYGYEDAVNAIKVITEQGEGKKMSPVPQPPFTPEQFPIPREYQLNDPAGDPPLLRGYSHFGRFVDIKNHPLPDTYPLALGPLTQKQAADIVALQKDFASFIVNLNATWAGPGDGLDFGLMEGLLDDAVACWVDGVIPQWS